MKTGRGNHKQELREMERMSVMYVNGNIIIGENWREHPRIASANLFYILKGLLVANADDDILKQVYVDASR